MTDLVFASVYKHADGIPVTAIGETIGGRVTDKSVRPISVKLSDSLVLVQYSSMTNPLERANTKSGSRQKIANEEHGHQKRAHCFKVTLAKSVI